MAPGYRLSGAYFCPREMTAGNDLVKSEVAFLVKVKKRHNESNEQLIRRFRKEVTKAKIMSEVRRRRWFVSKSELRRIKEKKAARRVKRRQYRTRGSY